MSTTPTPDAAAQPEPTTPTPDAAAKPSMISSIRSQIEAATKEGNAKIKEEVVKHFAQEEIDRRRTLVIQAVKKYRDLEGELKKAQAPDDVKFGADGKKVAEFFSQAAAKKLKETHEKFGNFRKAFEACLTNGEKADYEKLEKSMKGGGGEAKGEAKPESTEE